MIKTCMFSEKVCFKHLEIIHPFNRYRSIKYYANNLLKVTDISEFNVLILVSSKLSYKDLKLRYKSPSKSKGKSNRENRATRARHGKTGT